MPVKKIALGAFIATIIILYFVGGGEKYLSIRLYQDLSEQSPIATAVVFFFVFFVGTSFSLPVTGALTVASGIVFGAVNGFAISLLASTLGGTVALYSTRYILHDLIKRRFPGQVDVLTRALKKKVPFTCLA